MQHAVILRASPTNTSSKNDSSPTVFLKCCHFSGFGNRKIRCPVAMSSVLRTLSGGLIKASHFRKNGGTYFFAISLWELGVGRGKAEFVFFRGSCCRVCIWASSSADSVTV